MSDEKEALLSGSESSEKAPLLGGQSGHSYIISEQEAILGYKKSSTKRDVVIRSAKTVGRSVKSLLGIQGGAEEGKKGEFTSSIGVMLSMLGCVVGTGNIWRFPRIMATHADEGGALVFLIVWAMFLFLWSIPICLIEYGVGRYTKKSVVESFAVMIGPSYRWMGAFISIITLAIGSFYSVLLGYCGYYAIFFMFKELPNELEVAQGHFDDLIDSHWPIIAHMICIALACLSISRGVSTIEPVNRIIVPLLLLIVVFSFYWALYLPYAGMGIIHMFSPSWESFKDADLWRDAITQNAWDTGAGGALFLTYATYMKRDQGAVKLGSTTPIINNVVSLLCGMTIFCNVFSFEYYKGSSIEVIVDVLKTNGPFNTGITFIQMPLLYGSISGGRFLTICFFICVTLAGLSSLISILELCVHVLEDFGISRIFATVIVFLLSFNIGLASALSNEVFANQDAVWSQGLIVSGCLLIFLVVRYGILKFRREVVNDYGINDWPLPYLWVFIVVFICPIEGIGMLIWWLVDSIINNSDQYSDPGPWWQLHTTSLFMVFTQWTIAICISVGLNWWMYPIRKKVTIDLHNPSQPYNTWRRIYNKLSRWIIIHEQVELPPGIDTDPITTSSEATIGDPAENTYPMRGKKDPNSSSSKKLDFDDIKDETL